MSIRKKGEGALIVDAEDVSWGYKPWQWKNSLLSQANVSALPSLSWRRFPMSGSAKWQYENDSKNLNKWGFWCIQKLCWKISPSLEINARKAANFIYTYLGVSPIEFKESIQLPKDFSASFPTGIHSTMWNFLPGSEQTITTGIRGQMRICSGKGKHKYCYLLLNAFRFLQQCNGVIC